MNSNVFSILQSPDDGTPIRSDLTSEGGTKYEMTESGIIILNDGKSRPGDTIYTTRMMKKWDAIVEERIRYYTGQTTIAGLISNWSYRSIRHFNRRPSGEWLLDIGSGDGAHVAHLKDRTNFIALDRNMKRLEILKRRYPEAVAIYGNAASLPFKPGSLKNVFSCNAFEHIWYLKDAVMELHRCLDKDGKMIIVIPTEGGLWNLGRELISKPYFKKKHPEIDFDFVSHVEHCNEARQVIRSLETFFYVKAKYKPMGVPLTMFNVLVELYCQHRTLPLVEREGWST